MKMEYREILSDHNQKVDRLISSLLRVSSYVILCIMILNHSSILRIENNMMKADLIVAGMILFIPTIVVSLNRRLGQKVKYMIISCSVMVCCIAMCDFMRYTLILATLPLFLSCLYFDRKLNIYAIVTSAIALMWACLCNEVGVEHLLSRTAHFSSDMLRDFGILFAQYSFFSIVVLYLSNRTNKVFEKAFFDSSELRRNRDGLDVIVDYTDALFCARDYEEAATIILSIIKSLVYSLENVPKKLEGYVGIKVSKEVFIGVDENVEPKQFRVTNHQLIIKVDGSEYVLPIKENEESSTVFANKNKLTMFFYSDHELIAFVILHIHLEQTEEVLNKLIRVLYRNVRLAINNMKLTHDMYETQEELVRAFSEISESKSGQTGRHIKRVSEYMKIMAEAIHLNGKEKDSLVIASMMHDIGKLLIPESILEKPGKLTAQEFEVIKTHVQYGYKLLEYSPGRIMEIGRVIALQHHEKWDGTGYLGLQGEEIDYYSRIMAVVDVFDALMSKRSYKESWSTQDAYNEIVSQSGKHFDPEVVELFKAHFNEFLDVLNNYPDCEQSA